MRRSYFTVKATGKTYTIKDKLQSWAFFWDEQSRAWVSECLAQEDIVFFMKIISDGIWPGVTLSCVQETDYSFVG